MKYVLSTIIQAEPRSFDSITMHIKILAKEPPVQNRRYTMKAQRADHTQPTDRPKADATCPFRAFQDIIIAQLVISIRSLEHLEEVPGVVRSGAENGVDVLLLDDGAVP